MKLNNKGISLVELLVSMVIISIILVFLFQLLMSLRNETNNNNFAFDNQVERYNIIDAIQNDIIENEIYEISCDTDTNSCDFSSVYGKNASLEIIITENGPDNIDNIYQIKYTNFNNDSRIRTMPEGITLGELSFVKPLEGAPVQLYKITIPIYNGHKENKDKDNNNIIDDIEIVYVK